MTVDQQIDLTKLSIDFVFGPRMTREIWLEMAVIAVYLYVPLFDWIFPVGMNVAYFAKVKPALIHAHSFQ